MLPLILLLQNLVGIFGVIPVAKRTLVTIRVTRTITTECHPFVQGHSIVRVSRQWLPTERTFEFGWGWSGRIHDIAFGLKDRTLNSVALGARNFLYFHPLPVLSRPVIWVGLAEMRRTTRDLEFHGSWLIG